VRDTWAILTGEYPPAPGGVSDYTRQIAVALSEHGESVHVFAPPPAARSSEDGGVIVHTLPDHFGLRSLLFLSSQLDQMRRPRIFVQYVPHAFGWRAMNLPLCLWLLARSTRQDVWTMFHEVTYPFRPHQPWRHQVIALFNRMMAILVSAASERIFVSIPAWRNLLVSLGIDPAKIVEAPIPSNLITRVAADRVAKIRAGSRTLIGHFGTYQPLIAKLLDQIIPTLLTDDDREVLLMGRGSKEYAVALSARRPELRERMRATAAMSREEAGAHLASCDVLVQPYPDGISGRRGSAIAGLALGVPIVSNLGDLSESWWDQSRAVVLSPSPDPQAIVAQVHRVLADASLREHLSHQARSLYADRFDIERTIRLLLR
jgi:glycosyltransferase involved in cell wall biosynthesis